MFIIKKLPATWADFLSLIPENEDIVMKGRKIKAIKLRNEGRPYWVFIWHTADGIQIRQGSGSQYRTPYHNNCWGVACSDTYNQMLLFTKKFDNNQPKKTVKRICHLGTEIELEGPVCKPDNKIVHSSHCDGSVADGGCEIVTNHYPMNKWRLKDIKAVLDYAKEKGCKAGKTAGQHIHISHPAIVKVINFWSRVCTDNNPIYEFFAGISARNRTNYGFGGGSYRNQLSTFGTFEFRMFESTNHPEIIYKRMILMKWFTDYIIEKGNINTMFVDMPKKIKDIVYLLNNHEDNKHLYGYSKDKINNLLTACSWN